MYIGDSHCGSIWRCGRPERGLSLSGGVWCNAKVGDSDLGGFMRFGGARKGFTFSRGCLVHHVGGR